MNLLTIRNLIVIFAFSALLLVGCHPYEVDVQQGNILDHKVLSQLHSGLSKDAVKTLLGSPILVDPFDSNIWIYAYTNQINGGQIEKKMLVLKFKDDNLVVLQ